MSSIELPRVEIGKVYEMKIPTNLDYVGSFETIKDSLAKIVEHGKPGIVKRCDSTSRFKVFVVN